LGTKEMIEGETKEKIEKKKKSRGGEMMPL
jgi:hypothetical protein